MQQQIQSCMEDAQNPEVVESLETQRTQHMANPPVLPKTGSNAASSIDIASCDEDDHIQNDKNDQQPKKEDSYEINAPSEVEDRSPMPRIDNSPLPALNGTDHLCTGIGNQVPKESPGVVTVVWVNPKSILTSVYTINAITTLPTFGEELGKGGNGRVFKCYITTPDKNELQFACKVEKKRPLYQRKKRDVFNKICDLTDDKHFVVVNAYLIEEISPDVYIGYLLMEYFPLGNINSIFGELTKLDEYTDKIQQIEKFMLNLQSNEEFGKYMMPWQTAVKMRNKIVDCCKRLWRGIIDSLKHFHDQNLVHLDIKDYNILLRKTCEHKDIFICECDVPPFDVLIGDYDYCCETDTTIKHPKSVGTEMFQTFSMKGTKMQSAKPSLDLFGLLLTILRIRSKMGRKHECCSEMVDEWKEIVLTGGILESELSKTFADSWNLKATLKNLASVSEVHECNECKKLKTKIASVADQIKLEKNGISEVTKKVWKCGTFLCECFLKYTFVDVDSGGGLFRYLVGTLNDILKDYEITFIENRV